MPVKYNKDGLCGGPDRQKGESLEHFNERRHETYKESAIERKKEEGRWLPKEEYERQTGRAGKKD